MATRAASGLLSVAQVRGDLAGDRSNDNVVEHNRFYSTGAAACEYQFCNLACAEANPCTPRQCASYGNRFFCNTIGAGPGVWYMDPAGLTYAGGSGCSIPKGEQRLYTGGNSGPAMANKKGTGRVPADQHRLAGQATPARDRRTWMSVLAVRAARLL